MLTINCQNNFSSSYEFKFRTFNSICLFKPIELSDLVFFNVVFTAPSLKLNQFGYKATEAIRHLVGYMFMLLNPFMCYVNLCP